MSCRQSHHHRNLPTGYCHLATSLHHLPLSRCIAYRMGYSHPKGQMNHLNLSQDSLVGLSKSILLRTNTSHHPQDRQGCHHIRHRLCQPAEVDCKGIHLLVQMEWTQGSHYNSLVHDYLRKYRGRNPKPVSNFQGIYRQELGRRPNRLGHHLNILIVPTKRSHPCHYSRR